MKNTNLVKICFADKSNENLFKIVHELKSEFKFDLITHNSGEPCNKKNNYKKRILIIHGENDSEFRNIKKEYERIETDFIDETIILSSISDCRSWIEPFHAEIYININDLEKSKEDLKLIMNRVFRELDKERNHSKEMEVDVNKNLIKQ